MKPKPAPGSRPDPQQSQAEEKLPHERDQSSSDETRPDTEQNARTGKRGAEDVARGVEDTSKAPQLDHLYDKSFREGDD
ncbi:MAG: hypothetical protein ABWZ78_15255 [Burkholderiaceae bacterium]|jgi:hypothetical protein